MKNKGIICIITGLLLIAAALSLTFYNLHQDASAGKAADGIIKKLLPQVTGEEKAADDADMPVRKIDGEQYVAIISIPSINRRLPVYDPWNYKNLRSAACRFYGSVYTNDLIICAHNYIRHFGPISNLSIGDEVTLIDMNGNVFKYAVTEVETLGGNDVERMTDSSDWDLTLFTCTLSGFSRVTVRCQRVG